MDSHITKALGDFAARLTEMEHNFSALTARLWKVETYAASASNVSGSARSWPSLEQVDGSTAAGSHGPGSSDDNRNTRRRLDTFSSPDDEHARSAVLLQFPCEQYHAGVSKWINDIWTTSNIPACNKPIRIHCKTSVPPDMYSRRELNVRMVSPTKLTVHFATSEPISQSAGPSHLKTEKSENDLRLCGKLWPTRSKISCLKETRQVPSLSPHSTYDHKCSALMIAGAVWENRFSNLLHVETNRCLILLLPICVFLAFLMIFCDKSFCKPDIWLRMARPLCDGRPFASSPFCRLANRGPSLRGFPVWLTMQLATYLARCLNIQDSVPCYREGSQHQCSCLIL